MKAKRALSLPKMRNMVFIALWLAATLVTFADGAPAHDISVEDSPLPAAVADISEGALSVPKKELKNEPPTSSSVTKLSNELGVGDQAVPALGEAATDALGRGRGKRPRIRVEGRFNIRSTSSAAGGSGEESELGESSATEAQASPRRLGDNPSLWLGGSATGAATDHIMESPTSLEELGESNPTKSSILNPGMVVALSGGARQLYCSASGYKDMCDSKHVGKYEMLQVVDAGDGRIGLIHAHEGATSLSVPSSNAIVVGDLGADTVSLQIASTGRYLSDGTAQMTWDATEVGPAEKFKVTCYEKCPVGLTQQTVGGCAKDGKNPDSLGVVKKKPLISNGPPKLKGGSGGGGGGGGDRRLMTLSSDSSQLSCEEENYGFIHADSDKFTKGAWSRPIAIGYQGNSKRSEQYQVSPPGCHPAVCKKREASPSSIASLEDATCKNEAKAKFKPMISAGMKQTMVVTASGRLVGWGSDDGKIISGFPEDVKYSSVALGAKASQACALEQGNGKVHCTGVKMYNMPTVKLRSISNAYWHTCGIEDANGRLHCWEVSSGKPGAYSNVARASWAKNEPFPRNKFKFSSISTSEYLTCGIEEENGKPNGKLRCWGNACYNLNKSQTKNCDQGPPTGVKFSSVSVGSRHACGIEEGTGKVRCWGSGVYGQMSGVPVNGKFREISAGALHTCAIEKETDYLKCWGHSQGRNHQTMVTRSRTPNPVKFSSVSAGHYHTCGIEKETNIPKCFGRNTSNQNNVPAGVKWTEEPSCQTSHPDISGPASCTSCDPKGCNPYFTIIDPKTNTGTCTKKKCPTCKPKACCGEGHKHYVLNSKNLEGVCVRHSDDCTPVCIPLGSDDPKERRVCTKGCNRLLKSLKNKNAKVESEMYEIVTCQADKQVICDPSQMHGFGGGTELGDPRMVSSGSSCKMTSSFKAQAVCSYSPKLWNLGATCITNHVEGEKYPQCPDGANVRSIRASCRAAADEDDVKCSRLSMSY